MGWRNRAWFLGGWTFKDQQTDLRTFSGTHLKRAPLSPSMNSGGLRRKE
jgi:hypothetical protein